MNTEPTSITAGDSATWDRYIPNYLASSGWTAYYYLVNNDNNYEIESSAFGDTHRVELLTADTQAFAAGRYRFQLKVKKDSQVITVSGGSIDILPDFSGGPLDGRTESEAALEAIRATIAKKASKDQLSITVEGRTIQRMSFEDLIKAERYLESVVAREKKMLEGRPVGGVQKINVRFTK